MNITMTIEVTPEQAVRIAEILKEPAPINSAAPVQQPAAPPVQPTAVPTTPVVPAQVPTTPAPAVQVQIPVAPAPIPTAMPSAVPVQQPVPAVTPTPTAPPTAVPAMTTPPTAVKKYTADELSLASRPIVEAGRQQELLNLLHSFTFTDAGGVIRSVQNIRELPEELYPAFANGIRQLGGRI